MTTAEELVRKFAAERQLANAHLSLSRDHLKRAREYEQAIQREIQRKPLTTKDRNRLTKLIETGEIEYQGSEEFEPF